jgi:hypothetical protein
MPPWLASPAAGAGWALLSATGGVVSAAAAHAHGLNVADVTGCVASLVGLGGFLLNYSAYRDAKHDRAERRRRKRRRTDTT